MNDLITRLERAEGPDRELDAAIARATGWVNSANPVRGITSPHWYNQDRKCITELAWSYGPAGAFLPAFTASIDAALTLVPEGLAAAVLLDAINANQEAENWLYHLPRYIVIAALRAQQKDSDA